MDIEIVEVRDNRDPSGTGRVKVRAYNKENDEQNIPDEGLRWAHPVLPITSVTMAGVGHKPPAPPIGARLLCMFLPEDHDRQYPYYFGCIVRSERVDEKGIQQRDTRTGANEIDPNKAAPDQPIAIV
jgi:hypothetical protein